MLNTNFNFKKRKDCAVNKKTLVQREILDMHTHIVWQLNSIGKVEISQYQQYMLL